MAGRRLPVCIVCGRKFRPDRYNEQRQKCCPGAECRAARERARKRKYYRERREREKEFREKERQRCAEAMRRLRPEKEAAAKEAAGTEPTPTASAPPSHVGSPRLDSVVGEADMPIIQNPLAPDPKHL